MQSRNAAVLALVALTGCSSATPTSRSDTRLVFDSLLQEHSRHITGGDIAGIVNQYTPDAVVRSNHAAPLHGHEAIRSFVEGMLATVTFHTLTYHTEGLAVHGDSAWHIVTFGLTGTRGNESIADSGSAFVLWTRDRVGAWRIRDDILNSRLPLPTPPATER
jgi:ketosteroid isomerase-like protein